MFKSSLRAGFEPARGTPIGFRVQRLYLSAIAAMSFCATWRPLTLIQCSHLHVILSISKKYFVQ